jgi:hypothetical protein
MCRCAQPLLKRTLVCVRCGAPFLVLFPAAVRLAPSILLVPEDAVQAQQVAYWQVASLLRFK